MKRKYFKNNSKYFSFLNKNINKIHILELYFTKVGNICVVYKLIMC